MDCFQLLLTAVKALDLVIAISLCKLIFTLVFDVSVIFRSLYQLDQLVEKTLFKVPCLIALSFVIHGLIFFIVIIILTFIIMISIISGSGDYFHEYHQKVILK